MEGWSGMFGHGFLMASDNLTKHPSGPAMQPAKSVRTTMTMVSRVERYH